MGGGAGGGWAQAGDGLKRWGEAAPGGGRPRPRPAADLIGSSLNTTGFPLEAVIKYPTPPTIRSSSTATPAMIVVLLSLTFFWKL